MSIGNLKYRSLVLFPFPFAVIFLLCLSSYAHAQCGAEFTTGASLTVFESPPRFTTGQGWNLAPSMAELPAGTRVAVCQEQSVGLLFSSKAWVQIRFRQNGSERLGWVPREALGQQDGGAGGGKRMSWVGTAYAQDDTGLPSSGLPGSVDIYFFMFLAVIFGMAAKGLFDRLEQDKVSLKGYAAKTLRAILVSPIVFLGMATAGDFVIPSTGSLLVFLCMAFQNGFFWQTVLVRVGGAKS